MARKNQDDITLLAHLMQRAGTSGGNQSPERPQVGVDGPVGDTPVTATNDPGPRHRPRQTALHPLLERPQLPWRGRRMRQVQGMALHSPGQDGLPSQELAQEV